MRLPNERYEFIKGEVTYLYECYQVHRIPISGIELADKMGIILISYSSLGERKRNAAEKVSKDGFFLETVDGRNIIFYNDTIPYERMNMTVLHEIGHYILDHHEGSDEEEAEARFFAKYAAAPPPLIDRIAPKSPRDIADVFKIGFSAAVIAYGYYKKWLIYRKNIYSDYEIRLLRLFIV